MRRCLILAAVLSVPGVLFAQRGGFSPHFSGRSSGFHSGFNRGRYSGYGYYPLGYLDPLDSDYISYSGLAEPPPPVIVVQPTAAPAPEPASIPSNPQMIELQGDRYVQISGEGNFQSETIGSAVSENRLRKDAAPSTENPVALLVFRDGHREEVADYTISGGVLYARADYYSVGSWNRKIELSQLNVPETVSANRSNGFNFKLPTAPNEVVVGP